MRTHTLSGLLLGMLLLLAGAPDRAFAQMENQGAASIESRVSSLEHRISDRAENGVVLFLFGAICALWAQKTGRNAWLWFFMGAIFSVITILVLLYKNSNDKPQPSGPSTANR
jgi:hypothetical protein